MWAKEFLRAESLPYQISCYSRPAVQCAMTERNLSLTPGPSLLLSETVPLHLQDELSWLLKSPITYFSYEG